MNELTLTSTILNCVLSVIIPNTHDVQSFSFSYRFENFSSQTAYIFNKLYNQRDDQGRPDVHDWMVNITKQADHIVISKRMLPIPDHLFVEKRNIPCMTPVLPMEKFEETINLPLIVKRIAPYPSSPISGGTYNLPLYFELGFFLASAGREKVIPIIPTASGLTPCLDAFGDQQQQILSIGPILDRIIYSE